MKPAETSVVFKLLTIHKGCNLTIVPITIPGFVKIDLEVTENAPFIVHEIGGMNPISCQGFRKIDNLRDFIHAEGKIAILIPSPDKSLIEPANASEHLAPEHCAGHQQIGSPHNAHNIVLYRLGIHI